MDLPVWFIWATVLLVAVQADPTDQGPQMFSNPSAADPSPVAETPSPEKKQHKRQPKYEEVILYLTPSQIRALESGRGLMTPQQAAELRASEEGQGLRQAQQPIQYGALEAEQVGGGLEAEQGLAKPKQEAKLPATQFEMRLEQSRQDAQSLQPADVDLSPVSEQMKERMQNSFNNAGQKLQKEVKKLEYKQKARMQLREQNKNKSIKDKESQQLAPENNAPQTPRLELQKREKYLEFPLQFLPQEWTHAQQQYGVPVEVPHIRQQFVAPVAPLPEHQLIPIGDPQLTHLPLQHEKTELGPQNYAYLYFYPHKKPINNEELPLFYPSPQEKKTKELLLQQEGIHNPFLHLQPKFQLVPYEYGYQNKLEAQQILQAQLDSHQLDAHHLESHKLETHQLENVDIQQLLLQKDLEPHYQQQQEKNNFQEHKYEPPEVKLQIIPHTAAQRAQPSKEIKIDIKKLDPFRKQEVMELYEAQKLKAKTEAEEKEAHRLDALLKAEELKAEQFKAEQLKEELFKSQEFRDELFKSQEFKEQLFKDQEFKNEFFKTEEYKNEDQALTEQLLKDQELMENPFKNHESEDSSFKEQEFNEELFKSQKQKEELYKSEYQDLGYLQKLEPKRTQMYSILNPLFQGHSITKSLEQQKSNFPHHKIHLETGFKPLQYAPKFNDQKYARELEKMIKRNQVEKQKALAKAAAIANEPPEIIHSAEKVLMKEMPVIKHVEIPVPTPVMVSVPTPIEVKVPQPFPVPLEIIRPYPISIVKTEKVEVEKPIPIEIEKRVPVPVTKNVYVKVDKPYYVPKVVPVEIKREIPVEVPMNIKTPLKLSIIKHVWDH